MHMRTCMQVITPRPSARGKVIHHVIVVSTKIATSQDVGVYVTHMYNESVEFSENWLLIIIVCFKLRDTIHKRHKWCLFLLAIVATPINSAYSITGFYNSCAHEQKSIRWLHHARFVHVSTGQKWGGGLYIITFPCDNHY